MAAPAPEQDEAAVLQRMIRCETRSVTKEKVEVTWIIPSFLKKWQNKSSVSILYSSPFHAGGDEEVTWYLKLCLGGKKEEHKNHAGLFLHLMSSSKASVTSATYHLYVGNEEKSDDDDSFDDDDYSSEGELEHFKKKKSTNKSFQCGASSGFWLMGQNDIQSGRFLQDGSLTLGCKLKYEKEKRHTTTAGPCTDHCKPPITSMISLSSLSKSKFNSDLEKLFTTMQHSDVSFVVDGQQFRAHKAILSARSSVFAAMFEHPEMKENQLNRVDVEGIKPEVFEALLRFIYTNQVELKDEEKTKELHAAANRYLLDFLKHGCEEFLGHRITTRNCSELLILSDLHNAPLLKKMATDFIRLHPAAVMKTDGWKTLKRSRHELYCDMLENIVNSTVTD